MRDTRPSPSSARRVVWRERGEALAAWMLALAPIAIFPGANNRWGWATLLCALVGCGIALLGTARGQLPRWTRLTVLAVSMTLLLSALRGSAPLAQVLGRAPRYEGAIELVVLIAAGAAGSRLFGPGTCAAPSLQRDGRDGGVAFPAFLRGTAVSTAVLAFVALLESFGLRPLETDLVRPGSLAGNATDQGILGVIATAFLGSILVRAHDGRRTAGVHVAWLISGAAAGVVAVATSNSRAAIVALGIVVLGLAVMFIQGHRSRLRALTWTLAGAVGVAIVIMSVPLTRERLFGGSAFAQQTVGDRAIIWADAWRLILTAPIIGVGPNGFMDAITPFFRDDWYTRAQVGSILDSPHNVVLQAAAAGGILGVCLAAVIAIGGIVVGIRRIRNADDTQAGSLLGALLALIAAGVALQSTPTSPVTLVPLAVMYGVLVAAPAGPTSRPAGVRIAHAAGLAFIVVWAGFVTVCAIADVALLQGRSQAMRGDFVSAGRSFQDAAVLRPWDPDIPLSAAQAFGTAAGNGLTGGEQYAEVWAQQAMRMLPDSAQAQYVGGMVAMLRQDAVSARVRLTRAVELVPADPRVHHQLGLLRMVTGDLPGARRELERATALDPASAPSWRALAAVCTELGDVSCAAEAGAHADGR